MALLLIFSPAIAKQKKDKGAKANTATQNDAFSKHSNKNLNQYQITHKEQDIIRHFYDGDGSGHKARGKQKEKKKSLPPGLQKKHDRGGSLPPGWEKKIERGEVLDDAVYEQTESIPYSLRKDLPPQPDGTTLIRVEGKIIRILEATRTILDVFEIDF